MQQTTRVEVLATHLARTDRRALSQAWYSALHLAEHAAETPRAATLGATAPCGRRSTEPPAAGRAAHARATAPPTQAGAPAARRAVVALDAGVSERRLAKTDLARRIERGLARRTPFRGAASFAIRTGGGRIHLVVRADGARTRVVAVCPPPLRERVERALAQARFVLAARGGRAEAA